MPKGWGERIAKASVSVYLAMDPDDAGVGHAERLRTALSGLGVRCYGSPKKYVVEKDLFLAAKTLTVRYELFRVVSRLRN